MSLTVIRQRAARLGEREKLREHGAAGQNAASSVERIAIGAVGIGTFKAERLPDVRPGQRLDVQDHFAAQEQAHRAGRLADADGNGIGLLADGRRRHVPAG